MFHHNKKQKSEDKLGKTENEVDFHDERLKQKQNFNSVEIHRIKKDIKTEFKFQKFNLNWMISD